MRDVHRGCKGSIYFIYLFLNDDICKKMISGSLDIKTEHKHGRDILEEKCIRSMCHVCLHVFAWRNLLMTEQNIKIVQLSNKGGKNDTD